VKTFRTLDLSVEFYELSENSEVKGNLRDQLLRAAASVQECKTILKLAKVSDQKTIDTADKLGAWIFNLLKSEIQTQSF